MLAADFAVLCNVPYFITAWNSSKRDVLDQAIELLVAGAAAVLAGLLSERERRERASLEKTTQRLADVYRELQDNFEHMKRAERLYALGQLSAGLAHEIRNPLASIAGAAGILKRNSELEPKHIECLQIIDLECQVLLNLIINAIQAMPGGGKVVTLAGGRVLIQVRDQGCGIAREDRDRIFDPFFTTKPTGTGLGLAVAHQIVEQHGGLLTSEPNSDVGMSFSVLLPFRHEGHHETSAHSGRR
jgi:signal transduction histidine kinase